MEINWLYLIISILLLWIPAPFFFPREAKERMISNVYGFDFTLLNYLSSWQNWLDGLRAFAGTYCLVHLSLFPDESVEHTTYYLLAAKAVILGIAVALQTVHRNRIVFFHAPIFFLWGGTLILSDWLLGIYAIVAGLCVSVMSNSLELKLWITAAVLAIFGYMLHGMDLNIAINVALVIIPLAVTYSFNSHLVALTIAVEHGDEDDDDEEEDEDGSP